MKRKLFFLLRCLCFTLILFLVLGGINHVLEPKYYLRTEAWPSTPVFRGFYEMEPDSVDVLVLGSSVSMNNLVPQKLYDDCGIRSYNLSSEQQSPAVSYYWLREALRFQTPKLVIFEPLMLQDLHPTLPLNASKWLTMVPLLAMRWSPVKLEAVRDICRQDPSQQALDYLFTNRLYHSRWSSLTASDFVYDENLAPQLFGWAPGNEAAGGGTSVFRRSGADFDYTLREDMLEYLGRMAELCREKGIRFVMVKFPQQVRNPEEIDSAYRRAAARYGIDYYNFSDETLYARLGADPDTDCVENHGNLSGNLKNTALVGALLSEDYGLPAVEDAQYEQARPGFRRVCSNSLLPQVTDIDEYLRLLARNDYTVLISVQDDAAARMRASTKTLLRELGLSTEWSRSAMFRRAYIAVIADGEIRELVSQDNLGKALRCSGSFNQMRNRYEIVSTGHDNTDGLLCAIEIDGKDYAVNRRGLNIVVYDPAAESVVDSVCFDIYDGSACSR